MVILEVISLFWQSCALTWVNIPWVSDLSDCQRVSFHLSMGLFNLWIFHVSLWVRVVILSSYSGGGETSTVPFKINCVQGYFKNMFELVVTSLSKGLNNVWIRLILVLGDWAGPLWILSRSYIRVRIHNLLFRFEC